jgi:hypothetical protein
MKKNYILATDYKSSFFSAVFSFETSETIFKSLDKYDLLHSYMVCQIIENFEELIEKDVNRPFAVENVLSQIRQIVKNIKKTGIGNTSDKKLKESSKAIMEKYPEECKQIDEILQDDIGIVFCCFFVPQVASDLIKEYDLITRKNKKDLIHIDLNTQIVNTDIQTVSLVYDTAYDAFNQDKDNEGYKIYIDKSKELLKAQVELFMVSNGHLDRHLDKFYKKDKEN